MLGFPSRKARLAPFLPYVEKSSSAELGEHWVWPSSLTKPIEIDTLLNWLASCDAFHGGHCHSSRLTDDDSRPLWLVDVRQYRIVRAEPGMVYAALSYVWGRAQCVELSAGTVERLAKKGSLRHAQLPATIQDALELVAALGLTYLWVDRLCIVQDRDAEKRGQLKAMASIYGQSCFTIIAAQNRDATGRLSRRLPTYPARLWHLENSTARSEMFGRVVASLANRLSISGRWRDSFGKQPSQSRSRFYSKPATDVDVMHLMTADLLGSTWYSRGWTFQEFLFSRRRIIFHNNTVNWECHCYSAHEQQLLLPAQPCIRPTPPPSLGIDIGAWPNFHRYSRLAALFTIRFFTFPEDVHDAFEGASAAFARVFPGGLVTGLPPMMFDAALIWQPYHPVARRKPTAVSPAEAVLPSWSWLSWEGNVQSESWQSGYDYLRRQPGAPAYDDEAQANRWSTTSTVQWLHSKTLESARLPVEVLANVWRDRYMNDSAAEPPAGWRRDVDKEGYIYFTHEGLPGYEFWYPIPLPNSSSPAPATRSRYLHCKTRRARVVVEPKLNYSAGTLCAVAMLENPEGGVAGCLRLNAVDAAGTTRGDCEVIEMSAGSVPLGKYQDLNDHPLADVFDEWIHPSWSRREGLYEFYNVMQVKWDDGIASRVSVGRVEKMVWDKIATEHIEVTLS